MKICQKIILMGILASLFGCGHKNLQSETEMQICKSISFDQNIAEIIKKETKKELVLIPKINEYGEVLDSKDIGICSIIEENNDYQFILTNKNKFLQKGYLIFVFENDKNQKFIASIKGKNELDILKWRQTNGINYDLENKDIIVKLDKWKKLNDFFILGVGMDWLQLRFINSQTNFNTLASEVYEFCPDVVDQGTEDITTLIKELKKINGVYLWWD